MTARKLLFGSDFSLPSNWLHFGVGFEQLFDELSHIEGRLYGEQNSYPPHNLKKIGETLYELELAVAGFTQDQIEVDVEKRILTIRGKKDQSETKDEYLYRGVGLRSFTKTLALAETVEVRGAVLEHGMLKIRLEQVIPDADKPRRIAVSTPKQLSA